MRKYTVKVTLAYHEDYEDIIHYIRYNLENEIAAERYQKLFSDALQKLEYIGSGLSIIEIDGSTSNIRRMRIKRFSIIYEVNEENSIINVLGIVHQSSNWQRRFR